MDKETEDTLPAKLSLCREMRTFIRYFTDGLGEGEEEGLALSCFRGGPGSTGEKYRKAHSLQSNCLRKVEKTVSKLKNSWSLSMLRCSWKIAGVDKVRGTHTQMAFHILSISRILCANNGGINLLVLQTLRCYNKIPPDLFEWKCIVFFFFLPSHSDLDGLLSRTVMLFCYNDNLGSQK